MQLPSGKADQPHAQLSIFTTDNNYRDIKGLRI